MKSVLTSVAVLLFGVYGSKLLINHKLGWYINIGYAPVFFIAVLFCITVGLMGIFYCAHTLRHEESGSHHHSESARRTFFLFLPLACTLYIAFFTPPAILTPSQITSQLREREAPAAPHRSSPEEIRELLELGTDSSTYSPVDWLRLDFVDDNFTFRNGKAIRFDGSVIIPSDAPKNVFFVVRLVVTCCVIDARPVNFAVLVPRSNSRPKDGDWVHVEGILGTTTLDNTQTIIINPQRITKEKIPIDPYAYSFGGF